MAMSEKPFEDQMEDQSSFTPETASPGLVPQEEEESPPSPPLNPPPPPTLERTRLMTISPARLSLVVAVMLFAAKKAIFGFTTGRIELTQHDWLLLGVFSITLLCLRLAEVVKKLARPRTHIERDGSWWAKRLAMTALVSPLILPPLKTGYDALLQIPHSSENEAMWRILVTTPNFAVVTVGLTLIWTGDLIPSK